MSMRTRSQTPIGTPSTPASRNGQSRQRSSERRNDQIVPHWITSPPETTRNAVWIGAMACSQTADAATPKAKPAAPDAMPPRNAPSQRTASVVAGNEAKISDHIEQEREADGESCSKAERQGDAGALPHRQEFDGKHAEPERHVQRQCDDDAALRDFDERRVGGLQEFVEEVGAGKRARQGPEMQRQEDRKRDAGETMNKRGE